MKADRLAGIDLARALAVFGMFIVHVSSPWKHPNFLTAITHGRASVLFVLVAGVGITLLSRRDHAMARKKVLLNAVILLLAGLALQNPMHGVAVILQHYSVYFLLGILVLGLPTRALLVLASAWTVLGPVFWFAIARHDPTLVTRRMADLYTEWPSIAYRLLVSGPYPLIVWGAPLLWGMWLGRQDLASRRFRIILIVVGIACALLAQSVSWLSYVAAGATAIDIPAWRTILLDAPHSSTIGWLATSIGYAMAAVGACLMVAERWPAETKPLVDAGRMALSLYVMHLLVLSVFPFDLQDAPSMLGAATLLAAAGIWFARIWSRSHARGPAEAGMHAAWVAVESLGRTK